MDGSSRSCGMRALRFAEMRLHPSTASAWTASVSVSEQTLGTSRRQTYLHVGVEVAMQLVALVEAQAVEKALLRLGLGQEACGRSHDLALATRRSAGVPSAVARGACYIATGVYHKRSRGEEA